MSKLKIFVVYHKKMPVFRSDCFEPIQTGCAYKDLIPGFLHDNTGDNISEKNPYFAELTANYWVWKNYLPAHSEVEYIGFCHYRRFLDFWSKPKGSTIFPGRRSYESFEKCFAEKYSEKSLWPIISGTTANCRKRRSGDRRFLHL